MRRCLALLQQRLEFGMQAVRGADPLPPAVQHGPDVVDPTLDSLPFRVLTLCRLLLALLGLLVGAELAEHVLIQFMEVNVREQRRQDAALWSPGLGRVPLLTLEVTCVEELGDELEQAVVRDP